MSGPFKIADLSRGGGPKELSKYHFDLFCDDYNRALWPSRRNLTEAKLDALLHTAAVSTGD
jgi:hypothetical protein